MKATDDFRVELYERYVSTFKKEQLGYDEAALVPFKRWAKAKYVPLLQAYKNSAILEIGCGDGKLLSALKDNGFTNVTGMDISAEQVELVKKKGVQAEVDDVFTYLAERENKFDVIIGVDVIEHFTKLEALKLLRLMQSALTTNGMVLLQTPNGEGLFPGQVIYGDLTHLCIFSPNSAAQALQLYGFKDIRIYETSPIGEGLAGKIRVGLWEMIKFVLNFVRQLEGGKSKRQEIWTENMIIVAQKA
jgi:2-polyprenyl-3-methyl-5-hydroxy-6-metoxy-1,4-benzoquinol methylase